MWPRTVQHPYLQDFLFARFPVIPRLASQLHLHEMRVFRFSSLIHKPHYYKGVPVPVRILLVDDDQAFRSLLRRLLEKERDFSMVAEAGDGLEALELVRKLLPDIVLMDLAMPRLNGLESTQTIKAERPETKVIIFTQYQEDAYRQAAAEYGADAFLPKTTRLADLLTVIRQLTEGDSDEP